MWSLEDLAQVFGIRSLKATIRCPHTQDTSLENVIRGTLDAASGYSDDFATELEAQQNHGPTVASGTLLHPTLMSRSQPGTRRVGKRTAKLSAE